MIYNLLDLYDVKSGMGNKSRNDFDPALYDNKIIMFKEIFYNSKIPKFSNLSTTVRLKEGELERFNILKGDVLLTSSSETPDELAMSSVAYVNYPNTVYSGFSKRLRPKNDKTDYSFMRYWFRSNFFRNEINKTVSMTTRANLNNAILNNISIELPSLEVQKAIAKILSSLDDKIELNNKINKNLEEMAQALYKKWFVDFEFPNEDGEPYKSSNGQMVESELGLIPKRWEVGKLGDIIVLHDNKRVPLSKSDREKRKGNYRYYGAASLMDYVDDFIFEGRYLLLGEDGTVENENGYPVLQFVEGQFWVNNHAHVLEGKNGFDVNSLYILLKNTNVRSIITGAVQKKINQTNLKNLNVLIPNQEIMDDFNSLIKENLDLVLRNESQNIELAKLRDTLLPKLMSGEIEVPIEG